MEGIKINKLEIENVKRIKAVKIEPTASGLTIVGGNNNQGKTSVLDSIAWALGGEKYRPSKAQRDGSTIPPTLHIVMSNADEQPYYPEAPKELISPSELIRQQQEILARNGENQRKRERLNEITMNKHRVFDDIGRLDEQIAILQKQKEQLTEEYNQAVRDEETARKTVLELQDESTAELEASLANIEEINRKVRANMDKDKAEDDALDYKNQYNALTAEIDKTRREKTDLLQSAELPLPELSVKDGELIYKGQQWDNMSGSDRLKVSTAIVRKLNPKCGFVLMDKLEQMDMNTLQEFGQWLEQEGLQAIATRVSTGDECSIIIEDGYVKDEEPAPQQKAWKEGTF